MIDKVELRIPHSVIYSRQFCQTYQALRNDPKGPFRPSQYYLAVADLRKFGYPVILHTHNLHDRRGNHKLELVETGATRYSQMRSEVERIFDVDPGRLDLMRIDLAADVEGVPVSWFESNIRAKYKRWTAGIGMLAPGVEYSEMGSKGVQTFYLGKRPNVVRIYNKVAERQYQYRRLKAKAKREAEPLSQTFEQMFGHPEDGFILTRVERQMAAGRVPEQLSTFRKLRNAAEFDPFESLAFAGVGKPEPNPYDYDLNIFLAGTQFRKLIERDGFHRVRQFVNQHSQRNASRFFQTYADFLPDHSYLINAQGLFQRYRQSVFQQLAA
jgi:hypothetical protein